MSAPLTSADPAVARRFDLAPGETAWPTVGLCAGALAVQAGATWAAMNGRLPAAAAVLMDAFAAYSQFTVTHDATHKSVSRRAWLNELCGFVSGMTLFMPFEGFRRNHLHHHAHTNDPRTDPDYWVAGETLAATLLRCATILEYHYYTYLFRLGRRDGVWKRSMTLLAAMAAALALGAALGRLTPLLLYWFLPAQLASAALGLLFDYWPHRPHRDQGRMKDTSVIEPRWLDPFFLQQNIHLLHHLFPTIPWYRYRPAFGALEPGIRAEGGMIWDLPTALSKLRGGPLRV